MTRRMIIELIEDIALRNFLMELLKVKREKKAQPNDSSFGIGSKPGKISSPINIVATSVEELIRYWQVTILIKNSAEGRPVLHWGIWDKGEWRSPPPHMWPLGGGTWNAEGGSAARTRMEKFSPGEYAVTLFIPKKSACGELVFVVKYEQTGRWDNYAGLNYHIPLTKAMTGDRQLFVSTDKEARLHWGIIYKGKDWDCPPENIWPGHMKTWRMENGSAAQTQMCHLRNSIHSVALSLPKDPCFKEMGFTFHYAPYSDKSWETRTFDLRFPDIAKCAEPRKDYVTVAEMRLPLEKIIWGEAMTLKAGIESDISPDSIGAQILVVTPGGAHQVIPMSCLNMGKEGLLEFSGTFLPTGPGEYKYMLRVKTEEEEISMPWSRVTVSVPSGETWTKGPVCAEVKVFENASVCVCNYQAVGDEKKAQELGLNAVLNMAEELNLNFSGTSGIIYKKIGCADGAHNVIDQEKIKTAVAWVKRQIEKAEKEGKTIKIGINCRAGIGRSGSIAAACVYALKPYLSYEQAVELVKQARPEIWPHKGLKETLETLYPRKDALGQFEQGLGEMVSRGEMPVFMVSLDSLWDKDADCLNTEVFQLARGVSKSGGILCLSAERDLPYVSARVWAQTDKRGFHWQFVILGGDIYVWDEVLRAYYRLLEVSARDQTRLRQKLAGFFNLAQDSFITVPDILSGVSAGQQDESARLKEYFPCIARFLAMGDNKEKIDAARGKALAKITAKIPAQRAAGKPVEFKPESYQASNHPVMLPRGRPVVLRFGCAGAAYLGVKNARGDWERIYVALVNQKRTAVVYDPDVNVCKFISFNEAGNEAVWENAEISFPRISLKPGIVFTTLPVDAGGGIDPKTGEVFTRNGFRQVQEKVVLNEELGINDFIGTYYVTGHEQVGEETRFIHGDIRRKKGGAEEKIQGIYEFSSQDGTKVITCASNPEGYPVPYHEYNIEGYPSVKLYSRKGVLFSVSGHRALNTDLGTEKEFGDMI
ncbi:MAG: dual specificity protein phosphatase family protein, partial [Candidatus Omnitrophota bacterium]